MTRLPDRLRGLLRARAGPLAADLALVDGAGELGMLPRRLAPDAIATVTCGYCSTGCGLDVHLRDGRAVNLTPTHGHPVNDGTACPKGWEALAPLTAPDRATRPLLRNERGQLAPVSWDTALRAFCSRARAVQDRHGADAMAFLGTGQATSEELAFLGALAKHGMGMVHGDGNTRQCMASSVVAYKQSFGFDAPPYSYADMEQSDVIVLWGSNLAIAHPILWERACRNPNQPEIIVVDPRVTETAMAATLHVRPGPASDLVLLYGVARILIERGWIDADFIARATSGFEAFRGSVEAYTRERVVDETGVDAVTLERLARAIGRGRRVSLWWTMGVNQSHQGVRTAQAIIDLALLTGNIGRPGTGANSVTGQCNAMGSRLFSNTTSLFGGRDFASAGDRADVAAVLGIDAARIPDRPSLAYDQILEGVVAGTIKGLWIVATNTAHSWINQRDLDIIFDRLELLVVQDLYATTETARRADIVLPAAGWGEKEGTFINSERRVGTIKRVAEAPGQALSDFAIFRLVAEYWGCADMFEAWTDPEAVFRILQRLTAGRPCDFTGIDGYRALDERGGVQWPHPVGAAPAASHRRLFEDARFFHDDGRARFVYEEPRPPAERTNDRYPFTLLTGRGSAAQWHTQTRTGKSAVLGKLAPREAYVEIHPDDARPLGIAPHQHVHVSTRRGTAVARAAVTPAIARGQLFMPMHYAATNQLTFPAFDPYSRQPAYKTCAATIAPAGATAP